MKKKKEINITDIIETSFLFGQFLNWYFFLYENRNFAFYELYISQILNYWNLKCVYKAK